MNEETVIRIIKILIYGLVLPSGVYILYNMFRKINKIKKLKGEKDV